MATPKPTGPEIIDAMVEEPSLDGFFNRPSRELTEDDYKDQIRFQRAERARYANTKATRDAKRKGYNVDEEDDDE